MPPPFLAFAPGKAWAFAQHVPCRRPEKAGASPVFRGAENPASGEAKGARVKRWFLRRALLAASRPSAASSPNFPTMPPQGETWGATEPT